MAVAQQIRHESIRTHLLAGAAAVAVLVFGFGGWAAVTQFAGAVIGNGVVVVELQPQEGPAPNGRRHQRAPGEGRRSCESRTGSRRNLMTLRPVPISEF